MEPIIAVAVLAGLIAFFVFLRGSEHKPTQSPGKTVSRKTTAVAPVKATASPQMRFDAGHAKAQLEKRTIQGPAYVVDGDTIRVRKTQIRLFGVDAPEIDHPYGKKAKWALVSLCKGQVVRAEISATDTHGRTVAQCFLPDGRDLSEEMVKLGLAIDWPKFSGGKYRKSETADARKKLWLADARQKGRMHVWQTFDSRQNSRAAS